VSGRRAYIAFGALAAVGSQAGHLVAYELRFGSAAQQMQGSGAHAYFPALVKTGLGAVATAAIVGLFMVGLARAVTGRAFTQDWAGPSYLRLVAAVYTIQLTLFIAQELSEAAAAGIPAPSLMVLVFWGTLGQLPVAVIGVLALRWLLTRLRLAVIQVRAAVLAMRTVPTLVPALVPVTIPSESPRLHSCTADSSLAKRGPPSFLALSLS
jgi:hypothetical protein